MRVGIFTESYPPLINGVSTSVQTLIGQLEQSGHQVYVFTSRFPHYKDTRPGVFRYPSVNAIVEPDYVLPVPFSPRIAAIIPTLGLDIIHSQSPFALGHMARRVARNLHLPHVSTNHTLYTEYTHYFPLLPNKVARRAVTWLMRQFYNACDHVLAPSELTRERLTGYGVHAPITVVPTGIPAPPYLLVKPDETKRELGLPDTARVLLYVGRLAPEKNLDTLLRAFRRISQKNGDTFLVIAGSGKSLGHLQRETQHMGMSSRVVFTGFLERTRLDPLYAAADLFLFPSVTETQGLAVGEAMAAGLPCVVVNGGGAPEAITSGVNGWIVENDPAALAAHALALLADEPGRLVLADAARVAATELTPDNIARRVLAIYDEARVGKNGGRGIAPTPAVSPAPEDRSAPPQI